MKRIVAVAALTGASLGVAGGFAIKDGVEAQHNADTYGAVADALPAGNAGFDAANNAETSGEQALVDGLIGILAVGAGAGTLTFAGVEHKKHQ